MVEELVVFLRCDDGSKAAVSFRFFKAEPEVGMRLLKAKLPEPGDRQ